MMRYTTLEQLRDAYVSGGLDRETSVLWIDNDVTSVQCPVAGSTDDYETIFEMHPDDLLEQALDLLGIPRDHV